VNTVDLDQWSKDILWQVCHAGPYYSSILIAIDLDDLGKLTNRMAAVDMIQISLETLNECGLVIYSIADHGIYTRIRSTYDGYEAAGFPPAVRVSGPSHSDGSQLSMKPNDGTDYRNHRHSAIGIGPIEKMPLREHIFAYWDHAERHFETLWELEGRPHADHP
jgi:hypothetical protein